MSAQSLGGMYKDEVVITITAAEVVALTLIILFAPQVMINISQPVYTLLRRNPGK